MPQLESDEDIEAVLANKDNLDKLVHLLRVKYEKDEPSLDQLKQHFNLATEIKEAERLKKEAAMDEDFEAALMYKKKITQLQQSSLTADTFRQRYLMNEPKFSLRDIFTAMGEVEPHTTLRLIDEIKPWKDGK